MLKSYTLDNNGFVIKANTERDFETLEIMASGDEPFYNDINTAPNYQMVNGEWLQLKEEEL